MGKAKSQYTHIQLFEKMKEMVADMSGAVAAENAVVAVAVVTKVAKALHGAQIKEAYPTLIQDLFFYICTLIFQPNANAIDLK